MKSIILIFLLLPAVFLGQQVADRDYYLVDSLVLDDLTDNDRLILDSCLNLFSLAKDDTSKIAVLTFICDNLVHDVWSDYQFVQYELIEEALQKDITEKEKDAIDLMKGAALNNIGLYYEFQEGNISKALEYYLKALIFFEHQKHEMGEAMMLNRIGTIYTSQDNIEKGFEYYQKSLKIYQCLNEQVEIANTLNNLGSYYRYKKDYLKALDYYRQSLAIDIRERNKQGAGTMYNNIGSIYVVQEKFSKALISYSKGLVLSKELGDKNLIALILNNIGQVYYKQGDYKSAYFNANKALQFSKESGYLERISTASLLLSQIFETQNKPNKALEMFKMHTTTKDSMTNKSTRVDAVKQQSKYEYAKQKAVNDVTHEKQMAIEQEAKEKQKVIIYATAFVLSLVAGFLFFVFNRLKKTRKQKLIIEEAHEELLEKNEELLDSITYAKRIQNAILPPDNFVKSHLKDSFILYKPKDIVAGDFYWLKTIGKTEETILFAAADCTGHGVPGAMVSMVCNNALNRSIKEYHLTDPGQILDKTREIVTEEFSVGQVEHGYYVRDGMDIALCALTGNHLDYAGANNSLWIVRNGELMITKANKQTVGRFRSTEPFITHSIELEKGDTIYIFSDGYVDQFGGDKGGKFMVKPFKELLLTIQSESMMHQKESLLTAFKAWQGDMSQVDDVCIIGVRI